MLHQLSLVADDQMPEKENRFKDNTGVLNPRDQRPAIKADILSYHTHISNAFFQDGFFLEYLCFLTGIACGQVQDRKGKTAGMECFFIVQKYSPSLRNYPDAFLAAQSLLHAP